MRSSLPAYVRLSINLWNVYRWDSTKMLYCLCVRLFLSFCCCCFYIYITPEQIVLFSTFLEALSEQSFWVFDFIDLYCRLETSSCMVSVPKTKRTHELTLIDWKKVSNFNSDVQLTTKVHVALLLFGNISQMALKCGRYKKSGPWGVEQCVADVITTLWRPPWSIIQTYGNMESVCLTW